MNDEIKMRLNKLEAQGKISEEERKELEKLIFSESEAKIYEVAGSFSTIKIKGTVSTDIEIVGKEGKEIKIVEGEKFFSIREEGDTVEIVPDRTGERNGKINIYSILKGPFYQNNRLSLIIPKKSNVEAKLVSGDISIANLEGDVSVKSVSGDMKMKNINGDLTLISISGDIKLSEVSGKTKIETKSGDVALNSCKMSGSLKTYSGDLSIRESEVSHLEITVYSGDIVLDNSNANGPIYLKSIFGDINVELKDCDFRIEAEATFGEIYANLKGNNYHIESESVFAKDINAEANSVKKEPMVYGSKLVLENGSIPISIKTKRGDISIKII